MNNFFKRSKNVKLSFTEKWGRKKDLNTLEDSEKLEKASEGIYSDSILNQITKDLENLIEERNSLYSNRLIKIIIRSISMGKEEIATESTGTLNGKVDAVGFLLFGGASGSITGESKSTPSLKTFLGSITFIDTKQSHDLCGRLWSNTYNGYNLTLDYLKTHWRQRARSLRGDNETRYFSFDEKGESDFNFYSDQVKHDLLKHFKRMLKNEIDHYKKIKNDFSEIKINEKSINDLSFRESTLGYDYYDIENQNCLCLTKENLNKLYDSKRT